MHTNMSMIDRMARFVVGLALIAFALYGANTSYSAYALLGWIGVIPLATSLIGWCPLYSALGISTNTPSSAR